jgi:hypothetical protein
MQNLMLLWIHCFTILILFFHSTQLIRKNYEGKFYYTGNKNLTKKMHWLNSLEKRTTLLRKKQAYVNRYKIIYKRVTEEAKKRVNDKYIANARK